MGEKKSGRRGCFKFGCFGCAGVAGMLLIVFGVIAVMALLLGPPEQRFVEPSVTREIPGAQRPGAGGTGDRAGGLAGGGIALESAIPGRVVLDLSGAEFHIRPAIAGEPIRIEGNYNEGGFELIEEMQRGEDGGWTWTVRFRRSVSWVRMLHGDQHEQNRLEITLPTDAPFFLEGEVTIGSSRIELGGLAVRGVDLELGMGDHELSFSEPLPAPIERFDIDAGMGEFVFDGLGHASPGAVRIEGRMGELRVDLRGEWRNDATIRARWRMGACQVRVPDDVHVKADDVTVFMGGAATPGLRGMPELGADAPTIELDLSATMGEVRVVR